MKIVLIDKEEGNLTGGISVFTNRYWGFLKNHHHQVFILRYSQKLSNEKYIFKIPYYLAEPRSYIFLPTEKSLETIKKYLLKIKPDIVYTSCGLSPLDFFLPSLCHKLNIPIAGVWHGDFNTSSRTYQLFIKSIFASYLPFTKQLDLLHVFSDKMKKFHVEHGIKTKKILVLPNGIDHSFYSPGRSEFANKCGIKIGILFLGRLTTQKNPRVLLESFLNLDPPIDTKLIIVGHGEQTESLRQEFKDRRIIFTGNIADEDEKLSILRSCQIFVLPSRFEGMPLALLEAMSCGLTCITSDAGANRELIDNAGIVIETQKLKQQLPLALEICLKHEDVREILGKKARERAKKLFSQKDIFNELTSALSKTVKYYKNMPSHSSNSNTIELYLKKNFKKLLVAIKRLRVYLDI